MRLSQAKRARTIGNMDVAFNLSPVPIRSGFIRRNKFVGGDENARSLLRGLKVAGTVGNEKLFASLSLRRNMEPGLLFRDI